MATSGVYAVTMTGATMITYILQELGVLSAGDTADANDSALVQNKINLWLLQHNGPKNAIRTGEMMWTREDATLTLDTSSTYYDLKP